MPEETFRIRIRRDGRILLRSGPIGEERLRMLREMIEDCLGPVTPVESEDSPPRPATGIADADKIESEKLKHLQQGNG